ncbi:D-alanine--D-alanine ligase [Mesonia maritima]|uniref:D-alanine--D-alanine ligase n=1 Tax=Mesonia maritima TaxID=1793873 RepID=A0ABU1K8Y4_9FLAO|nr:D-alanine--D-alanine ligase [Mesonia maritima]MDR6301512.1 D-alanine-D-alanine ligase [Mesonia maritima]
MKKKIAIAMGGYSNEYKISLNSGNLVYKQIDTTIYEAYRAHILEEGWFVVTDDEQKHPIDKADFSITINGEKIIFDCVFNIIHGTPGEDGIFQGYLEMLNIPQTACDYYQAALTFNKRDCISILKAYGIKTATNYFLNKGDEILEDEIIDRVGLPCFVKANKAGSSFGVSKVKRKEDLMEAIHFSFQEDEEVIIESFLDGTEVSVGVIEYNNEIVALPVTEIISENEFFDYEAKYLGQSQEITPANISEKDTRSVQEQAKRIFKILKLKGLTRAEFIFYNNEPHFVEINTCPGLSEASILPQQAKAAGITLKDLFSNVIEAALKDR